MNPLNEIEVLRTDIVNLYNVLEKLYLDTGLPTPKNLLMDLPNMIFNSPCMLSEAICDEKQRQRYQQLKTLSSQVSSSSASSSTAASAVSRMLQLTITSMKTTRDALIDMITGFSSGFRGRGRGRSRGRSRDRGRGRFMTMGRQSHHLPNPMLAPARRRRR